MSQSVRQMMSDQLCDIAPVDFTWGFGAVIQKAPAGEPARYGWAAGGYAMLWVDRDRKLIACFAMPLAPPCDNALLSDSRRLVYEAMTDSKPGG